MKVTTDTPDLLIIEDRPIILGIALGAFILVFVGIGLGLALNGEPWGLLFALIGGGLGLGAFWAFVRRVQVVFHRPESYVEFRRRNIFGASRVRHALGEIERAEIEESSSSDNGTTWRVALVIEQGQSVGRHPITLAYSNGSGHHRTADAINRWLDAARASAA
jgi:hypothetical protein